MEINCLPIMNVGMSGVDLDPVPPIINDGNTVAWFDSAESWMVKDGSNFVSNWLDRSGNANNLLQAVGTNQPLWSSSGVLFDGVDNFMKCVAFTLVQPEFIYLVFKQVTWVASTRIFDGNTTSSGIMRQQTSTPNLDAFAGEQSSLNGNLALDTYGIARVLFNGASSKFQINETAEWTGDLGASDMGGFTLGGRAAGDLFFSNIGVKEIIIRKTADGATDEAVIYNYLKSKHLL